MREQETNEHRKLEVRQRNFAERFAAWWNRGAEKAKEDQATRVASETPKRKAA